MGAISLSIEGKGSLVASFCHGKLMISTNLQGRIWMSGSFPRVSGEISKFGEDTRHELHTFQI